MEPERQVFNPVIEIVVGDLMLVKAVYENSVLRPLEKLDLNEGDMVEIEVKKDAVDRLGGLVKISQRDVVDEIIESPELGPF
jgi:predicted DNA-binding antitoxin AbrB/MazE fold protein